MADAGKVLAPTVECGGVDSWDVSDGPSLAYQDEISNTIRSESFAIAYPGAPRIVPEPASALLITSGVLVVLVLFLRHARVQVPRREI